MTLSRFLRDFLYIPLGGNRGGKWKTARNLMLTMVAGGLWHGAAWGFVLLGHASRAGLVIERWLSGRSMRRWLRWAIVFNLVGFGWGSSCGEPRAGPHLLRPARSNPAGDPLDHGHPGRRGPG